MMHMIDKGAIRSRLQNMERAAEEILQQDSAFYEALQALKWEVDSDPRVQSAMNDLRAAGRRVFSSFVPHIKIRVRTEEGIFALPRRAQIPTAAAVEQVGRLTQELRNAASAVIMKSRYRQELNAIVNEAVGASDSFEGIASEIESAGYEVLICVDLSAYAQVQESSTPLRRFEETDRSGAYEEPLKILLSDHDLKFLKALKIKIDKC
jgi:hypothetical protein